MTMIESLLRQAAAAKSANDACALQECLKRAILLVARDRSVQGRQNSAALARFLLEVNRFDEAAHVVSTSLLRWPKDVALLNMKGLVLKRQQRLNDAATAFRNVLRLEPRNTAALMNLGNTYLMMREPAKAVEAFTVLSRCEPVNSEARRLHGQALRQLHDTRGAITSLRAALSADPRNCEASIELTGVLTDLGRHDEALAVIENALGYHPEQPRLMWVKTVALRRSGRRAECEQYLSSLIDINPDAAWAHHERGALLEAEPEKANPSLRKAVELEPDNVVYLTSLADSYNRSRYGDEGAHVQSAYEVALGILAKMPRVGRHSKVLRDIFLRCGDFDALERVGSFKELGEFWARNRQVAALHHQMGSVSSLEDRRELVRQHRIWGEEVGKDCCAEPGATSPVPRAPGQDQGRSDVLRSAQPSGFLFRPAADRRLRSLAFRILLLFLLLPRGGCYTEIYFRTRGCFPAETRHFRPRRSSDDRR